ncbi:PHP-like protein [Vulcanimicrobium alpinum]|uniref:PHP-like protein n=1 Tax=Vulcanimicrobium alpinum TaxID=3016050 RepID=A0AAN1XXT6_UNVUL|nr:PHP domain-containing protein [Vulcanimicrobium alpinum]BDE06924.1 PHP-like protein [Vulcanimicrobium alpinum]
MTVDFHSHTRESDGTLTPRELVGMMKARGVSWFSITDHDTTRAYEAVDAPGQHVIPGIEINTTWDGSDVHILGYGIPTGPSPLAETLARNRTHRRARVDAMVRGLNAAGYPLTVEQVLAQSDGGHALGRPHVAKALVLHGMVPDIETAFRTLLSRGTPGYAPSTHITPFEAIDVVRACGGVAVLAHPGRLRDDAIVDDLVAAGLAGIEVFYPTHTTQQTAHYRAAAARANLVMTAGSDFHDVRWNARGVGVDVDPSDVRPFLELVAERV